MTSKQIRRTTCARIPTSWGEFQLCHYENSEDTKEHLAVVLGDLNGADQVLTRVHSECFTGDVLGSLRCDCGEQLEHALKLIAEAGCGVLIYLRQEGRGIGLEQKLRAYNLQDEGYDTVDANLALGHQADEREYWAAAGILADLGVQSIQLLTNNPAKIEHLQNHNVIVDKRIALQVDVTMDNIVYLKTKVERMRHMLTLEGNRQEAPLPTALVQRIADLREQAETHFQQHNRPLVTVSYAQSLDGSIAAEQGSQYGLSGAASLAMTHALRAAHDAILVGIGTVLADDPQLTVRMVEGSNPQPVVVDSHLRIPDSARLLSHPCGLWIATKQGHGQDDERLSNKRPRIFELPADHDGRVDLKALLVTLGRQGIRSVMVEGGAGIITSFLSKRLADQLVVTIAPLMLGGVRCIDRPSPQDNSVPSFPNVADIEIVPLDPDFVVWGRPVWPLPAQEKETPGHG